MSDKKIYGYVILHKDTGEQWGGTYASKAGAANAYNSCHNSYWEKTGHKFADQDIYVRKALVLQDE